MFVGLGTVINVLAIVIGSALGIFAGAKFKEEVRDLITTALGFVTLMAAADALRALWNPAFTDELPKGWAILALLISLLLGALIGTALDIEKRLEVFGVKLKKRFDPHGSTPFVDGFVSASLLFVIGPMAILGSISDGMGSGINLLALKSILDGVTSIAFAATLGWGVAVSALPVGLYQFVWTGVGLVLGSVLPEYQILGMTVTGGILLLGISFRMLKIKQVPVGNLLPALFLAPIIAGVLHAFN
ncbi:MAG: DUF554 family protein [Actinobacteria bacterium]|uniref:Unannotated protein n=1 Tax=freshwater metagenome TaxID=449393 RepID=A0A6J6BCK4_9ZZZZ|nr:DUF554 family protein [Actinomycetota bacterium]